MGRFNREELSLFAVLSRGIWLRGNRFIFEGDFTPPNVILTDASKSLEDFKRCWNVAKVLMQNGESTPAIVVIGGTLLPKVLLNWIGIQQSMARMVG
jgi:hypothetical protein